MKTADEWKRLAARRWSQLQVALPTFQCNDCSVSQRRRGWRGSIFRGKFVSWHRFVIRHPIATEPKESKNEKPTKVCRCRANNRTGLEREESLREWKVAARHQVLLCEAASRECVTRLSRLHQGAVASPFTLPQQDNRTLASHGRCCWLTPPPHPLFFWFFFSSRLSLAKTLQQNISSTASKRRCWKSFGRRSWKAN